MQCEGKVCFEGSKCEIKRMRRENVYNKIYKNINNA